MIILICILYTNTHFEQDKSSTQKFKEHRGSTFRNTVSLLTRQKPDHFWYFDFFNTLNLRFWKKIHFTCQKKSLILSFSQTVIDLIHKFYFSQYFPPTLFIMTPQSSPESKLSRKITGLSQQVNFSSGLTRQKSDIREVWICTTFCSEIFIRKPIRGWKYLQIRPKFRSGGILGILGSLIFRSRLK